MTDRCKNCGSSLGGVFGATPIPQETIEKYKQLIDCPDEICSKCSVSFINLYNKEKLEDHKPKSERSSEIEKIIDRMPLVSTQVLPPQARYKLIETVSFQSTLGTGFFSEFGSDISNLFGTESRLMNEKMEMSVQKCKTAIKFLAYRAGGNAVIGVDFDYSTNSRDATTVAAQGTAAYIENIDEVFKMPPQ